MQQSVRDVAKQTSTPVVDASRLLDESSAYGLAGYDWYVDQVHPSVRGHQLIAQAIAATLRNEQIVSRGEPWSAVVRREAYRGQMSKLGDRYLAAGQRRVEWLEHWARRDRLREDIVPLDARGVRDLANSYIEFADYPSARIAYEMALSQDPNSAIELIRRALQLFQGGRISAAERIADLVLQSTQDETAADLAHVVLTICALQDDRSEDAEVHANAARAGNFDFSQDVTDWLGEEPDAKELLGG